MTSNLNGLMKYQRKIAIIGAGPAGLISGKYCLSEGFNQIDIFEQGSNFCLSWVYTEETGFDKDGIPVLSGMYKNLRTSIPKEIMELSDHHYPSDLSVSFLESKDVLAYFQEYAEKFSLKDYIKLNTRVLEVKPIENDRWNIRTKNLLKNELSDNIYDVVFVCSGHYTWPIVPNYPGKSSFMGLQMHSHDYRTPDVFIDKKVLVVGLGVSGQDLSRMLLKYAKKVYMSYNKRNTMFYMSDEVIKKPKIAKINCTTVEFEDYTVEEIDAILYCTGYEYKYPFLSKECKITIEKYKWVKPLYKEIINIEHPTMGFIGIPSLATIIPLYEIQVRFFISTINNHFKLPPKDELYRDLQKNILKLRQEGVDSRHMHVLGNDKKQKEYFTDLATTANIANMPQVINEILGYILRNMKKSYSRDLLFKIIDDHSFSVKLIEDKV